MVGGRVDSQVCCFDAPAIVLIVYNTGYSPGTAVRPGEHTVGISCAKHEIGDNEGYRAAIGRLGVAYAHALTSCRLDQGASFRIVGWARARTCASAASRGMSPSMFVLSG